MLPIFILLTTIFLDQFSKYFIASNMQLHESFVFVNYLLNITYIKNKGAAFGILKDHRWIFLSVSALAIIAMSALLIYLLKNRKYKLLQVALAFMIGGGAGNMIDRLYSGEVVDFIEFAFVEFAVFNLADTFVFIGTGLFLLCLIINRKELQLWK